MKLKTVRDVLRSLPEGDIHMIGKPTLVTRVRVKRKDDHRRGIFPTQSTHHGQP